MVEVTARWAPGLLCFPWCGVENGLMKEELLLPGCLCVSLCNPSQVGCSWQVRKRSRVALHNVLHLNYSYLPLAWLIFLVLMRLITRLINMCPKCEHATWSVGSHDSLLNVAMCFRAASNACSKGYTWPAGGVRSIQTWLRPQRRIYNMRTCYFFISSHKTSFKAVCLVQVARADWTKPVLVCNRAFVETLAGKAAQWGRRRGAKKESCSWNKRDWGWVLTRSWMACWCLSPR